MKLYYKLSGTDHIIRAEVESETDVYFKFTNGDTIPKASCFFTHEQADKYYAKTPAQNVISDDTDLIDTLKSIWERENE